MRTISWILSWFGFILDVDMFIHDSRLWFLFCSQWQRLRLYQHRWRSSRDRNGYVDLILICRYQSCIAVSLKHWLTNGGCRWFSSLITYQPFSVPDVTGLLPYYLCKRLIWEILNCVEYKLSQVLQFSWSSLKKSSINKHW